MEATGIIFSIIGLVATFVTGWHSGERAETKILLALLAASAYCFIAWETLHGPYVSAS